MERIKIQEILQKHLIGEREAEDVLEAASEIVELMTDEIFHGTPSDVVYSVGRKLWELSGEVKEIYAAEPEDKATA